MKSRVMNLAGQEENFALNDRGLAYGDGLFETILVHAGEPVWWGEHWQRLLLGARVLNIPAPDEAIVRSACSELLSGENRCVLKIILTRGVGGRGYAAPVEQDPRILISVHPAPSVIHQGINLRWCETRMSQQTLLAGIKHLNRLEQVLARNEWQDQNISDGLMCDQEDNIVCATSANVFAKIHGRWLTPKLDRAGIAGIARGWVCRQWPHVQEAHISRLEMQQAEAVFICNAVRGILAVNRIDALEFTPHRDISDLQNQLAEALPAFARGENSGT